MIQGHTGNKDRFSVNERLSFHVIKVVYLIQQIYFTYAAVLLTNSLCGYILSFNQDYTFCFLRRKSEKAIHVDPIEFFCIHINIITFTIVNV